jgi:hypothetical protein
VQALGEAALTAPDRALGANATTRKRIERARGAVIGWVRREMADEHERQLLAVLLGEHLPRRQRRNREAELVRILGSDQVIAALLQEGDRCIA